MNLNGFLAAAPDELVLSATELEGIFGEIASLNAADPRRRQAIAKMGKATKAAAGTVKLQNRQPIHSHMTAKAMLESKQYLLEPSDRAMLQSGAWKVDDYDIVSTKLGGGKSLVQMFEAADTKVDGLRNLAFGKTESTQNFLIKGIILQSAVAAGDNDSDAAIAAFGTPVDQILNGCALFKINQLQIFDKRPLNRFKHNRTDVPANYIELESPRLVKPFEPIQFDITTQGLLPAHTWIRILFVGAITSKN